MKMTTNILGLHKQLQLNGGVMPPTWQPYAESIQLLLQFVKAFTNDEIDVIIDEIIAAIELAQNF